MKNKDQNIVFFDGVCVLCNGFVKFITKRDKDHSIKFASLQGRTAIDLNVSPDRENLKTIVYLKGNKKRYNSDAVLEIFSDLKGIWTLVNIFKIVPRPLRDLIYKFIAKNRYKFFGKTDTCSLDNHVSSIQILP